MNERQVVDATFRFSLRCRAMNAVKRAVLMGDLPDLSKENVRCSDCTERARVYDHRNYYKPLEVSPVCISCNSKRGPAIPYEPDRPHWTDLVSGLDHDELDWFPGRALCDAPDYSTDRFDIRFGHLGWHDYATDPDVLVALDELRRILRSRREAA